ncbi:lethal(2) giant larvae protein homolog 1-like [Uloborus diversus]|uniref:lethal(2) giant larvae protein homolog 1-like n=1 Tax=Uloborus diversus TaxID=327109 RepID=UPI0024093609|nr:lethal(2) giant larvae protein homolog 1-like [Uloborus diversus]
MFKFKGNRNQQSSTEIAKSVEDFFTFSKISTLGFPHKPTALSWDSHLCLMAIGTQHGSIRIYGAPGVQFCGELRQRLCIIDLIFIPKKARLISLCSDNSLHLWELNERNGIWCIEEIKSFVLMGMMKKISTILLNFTSDILYIGTMCGNIYTLNVETFEMAESVIYQDVVVQNIPDDKKLKQGSVKSISYQPHSPDCLLIGYQQGLMALWDIKKLIVISTFISTQSLEFVTWHHDGMQFISSHSDGSYVTWNTQDPSKPSEVPITLYGPFACKAIEKILWNSVKGGDDYIIFSGGMPRSSYGDKFTVTIMCGDRHQVLDLSSKVIDFFTISDAFDESEFDNPNSLIILLEEELIAIDLESDSWLPFKFPYLEILHSSPITCFQYCPDVHKEMWRQLSNISELNSEKYTENEWPIKGGKALTDNNLINNLLVTGHESGSIKVWKASSTSLQLIYEFHASQVFVTYESEESDDAVEEWPPFRKIGSFDPLSDDPRLAIRNIVLNDITRTLIAGGSSGQILVLQLLDIECEKETIVTHITIGDKWDSTLWCNPQPLIVKHGKRKYGKGFHVQCTVQLTPPAPVTSLAFHAEWNLVAVGVAHGFVVYDIVQKKCVISRYTLNTSELSTVIANISPKTKSLKKTFRESFRKLKMVKTRSLKRERAGSLSSDIQEDTSRESSIKRDSFTSSPDPTVASSPSPELKSFDIDAESRCSEDIINSVQCVYFSQSFIINNVITTPTLWIGTSSGSIYIYTITMPASDCRTSDAVMCQLGKEIQLKHQASVLSIHVIDHRGYPLPDPINVQHQRTKPADLCGSHRVVVCTEEQIKIFTLPSMKPYCKNKISLTEGYNISKVGFSSFPNKSDPKVCEYCLICLSSSNGITLYNLPDLRKCISFHYSSLEDIEISSKTSFAYNGLLVSLSSPSEFHILSLSTAITTKPACKLELPEGIRNVCKPLENIVLEMQNISLINGSANLTSHSSLSEAIDPQVQNELNDIENASEEARRLSLASGRLIEENPQGEAHNVQNNIQTSSETAQQQIMRAPLATIEELNSSDDSHLNVSRSYCKS